MFRLAECQARIAALTSEGLPRDEFITACLRELRSTARFGRARYYEVTDDVAAGRTVAVLVHQVDEPHGGQSGFMVDLATSTLNRGGVISREPVIGEWHGDDRDPPWVAPLDLAGRRWVEVPMTAAGDIIGIFACDWTIESGATLDGDGCKALRALGAMTGAYLGLKPIAVLEAYREARRSWNTDDPQQLVFDALTMLSGVVDAATAAVFAFDWTDQSLTKIQEHIAAPYRKAAARLGELPERYAVGEYLTGQAWRDPAVHHVVSFESLRTHRNGHVAEASKDWHDTLLGHVQSVVYVVLGSVDRRFLIRFINRSERPELPFVYEVTVLDAIVSELRSDVDAAVAKQRSLALTEIAEGGGQTTDPVQVLSRIERQLEAESIPQAAILCHQADSTQFGFSTFRGPRLARCQFDAGAAWQEDPLYVFARARGIEVLRLSDHPAATGTGLAKVLSVAGFAGALSVPIESGQTRGVLLVPLDAAAVVGRGEDRLPPHCGYGTVPTLDAFGRLVGNAVELRHSQAKVDGARRALGFLGHEIRAPLAALASSAEEAVNESIAAITEIAPLDPELAEFTIESLDKQLRLLYESQKQVDVALELAPIVAKESEGLMELNYRPTNLRSLVGSAVAEVEREMLLDGNQRAFFFNLASSTHRLGEIVCDPNYLRHAVKNVVRNAAKYSLPRPRQGHSPMLVDIFGEPQTGWVAIKVRNYGYGIPDDQRDLIYEPWVRGEVTDRLKAIGGMGLGLFLTRRIMAAHSGSVRFTSKYIGAGRIPERTLEGFQTVFELRVPVDLKPGKHVMHADGRLEGPLTKESRL